MDLGQQASCDFLRSRMLLCVCVSALVVVGGGLGESCLKVLGCGAWGACELGWVPGPLCGVGPEALNGMIKI